MEKKQLVDNAQDMFVTTKRSVLISIFDASIVFACFLFAIVLTFKKQEYAMYFSKGIVAVWLAVFYFLLMFLVAGIHKIMWRYSGVWQYARLLLATTLGTILTSASLPFLGEKYAITSPRFYVIFFIGTTATLAAIRMVYALIYFKQKNICNSKSKKKTMIIGAGYTAKIVIEELVRKKSSFYPVCIVDDDKSKQKRLLNGIPVVGGLEDIVEVAKKQQIETIIFAIPSLKDEKRREIIEMCVRTGCEVKILPFVSDIIDNIELMHQAKDVKIEDLLSREQISFNFNEVKHFIENKTILLTGAGGSIGSELARQISVCMPKKLVMLDIYENTTYDIQQELRNKKLDGNIVVEIASMTDYKKMEEIFTESQFDIVFHAAAHKHVPLMEYNPEEAIKNNVFGTKNIIDLCDKFNVQKMVMISTDKAVNPTNVMGATKRLCEMMVECKAQHSKFTQYAAVRFGNVLGSHGSVIPLFKNQILQGGPVTVTDKEMIRYFMTIPEAVSLVLQAGVYAKGGEVFVLDMGKPVKILTLAENMIRLMGYEPYVDIDIKFTGLRPGEKLYEEILMSAEGLKKTSNNKIYVGKQLKIDCKTMEAGLDKLAKVANENDKEGVIKILQEIVGTYHPNRCNLK